MQERLARLTRHTHRITHFERSEISIFKRREATANKTRITMSSRAAPLGGNLMLASALALLSYVPFQWVAKGTLLLCVFLFVVDPFPPMSRLLSIVGTLFVAILSRAYRRWHEENAIAEENEAPESPIDTTSKQKDI
jgi:hypothetical protein